MTPIDELKQYLTKMRQHGLPVVSVDYVLGKLREAEVQDMPLRPPEESIKAI
ncbi:hypothetical protein [Paenibacillus prosopidis]|uniref:Uncharacterized protein n=1 Tax=Paenibacillus prosopidis TaxID=630520 RepID=A0A368VST7_9BACL|nr:hypothetical protein [Paenibacillus prosopidis]RCW44234.1 hypothetical protein DFP97_11298 [Paenibacillus prosopidis]